MQTRNGAIFSLGLFFLVLIWCQNLLAQDRIKTSLVYLKDKEILIGELTAINDSTYKLLTPSDKTLLIRKSNVDSMKICSLENQAKHKNDCDKVKIGFVFSIQPIISKHINTDKYSFAAPPDILKSFCLGPGINIGNGCISILPSLEDLGNTKTNFLFYPDFKMFFDDIYKSATGYIEFNYFNNSFLGVSKSASVINCNIGAMLGDPKFKIALNGGVKFIDSYIYFNLGLGMHFLPNNSKRLYDLK